MEGALNPLAPIAIFTCTDWSQTCLGRVRLNVLSLPALLALGHVELHLLPFLQAAKAVSLNSGEMHEDILPILTTDEALCIAAPLSGCVHNIYSPDRTRSGVQSCTVLPL
jgi:hypothetical protein